MKRSFVLFAFLSLVYAGCASQQDSGPPVTVHLTPLDTVSDLFYFPGPIGLRYGITVSNPTNEPVTLRRLDLNTVGTGAYFLRSGSTPMNVKVAPNSSATFSISTWGRARGGYLSASEPVTIQGRAYFDGPNGPFVKLFQQNIMPGA